MNCLSKSKKGMGQRRSVWKKNSVWIGLGLFGIALWSITIPSLIGLSIGIWLDTVLQKDQVSWVTVFLATGIILGCLNAWYWLNQEHQKK